LFSFNCKIPETNTLTIELWDKDFICDELIGHCQINLTERILSKSYMSIKTKPVEEMPLYDGVSIFPQGHIRYILDIVPTVEIVKDQDRWSLVNSKIQSKTQTPILSRKASKEVNIVRKSIPTKKSELGKKDQIIDNDGKKIDVLRYGPKQLLRKNPVIQIDPIPARLFEIRVIIWNAENIPNMDVEGTTDA